MKGFVIPAAADIAVGELTDIGLKKAGLEGGAGQVESGRRFAEVETEPGSKQTVGYTTKGPGALDYARGGASSVAGAAAGAGTAALLGVGGAAGFGALGAIAGGWQAGRAIGKALGVDQEDIGIVDLAKETAGFGQHGRSKEIEKAGEAAMRRQAAAVATPEYKERKKEGERASDEAVAAEYKKLGPDKFKEIYGQEEFDKLQKPSVQPTTSPYETPPELTAPRVTPPKVGSKEWFNLPTGERTKAFEAEMTGIKERTEKAKQENERLKDELEQRKQRLAGLPAELAAGRQEIDAAVAKEKEESAARRAKHDELLRTGSIEDIMAASDKRQQEFEDWRNQRAKEGAPWAQTPRKPLAQVRAEAEAKVKGKTGTEDVMNTIQNIINLSSKQANTQKYTKPEEWTNPMMPTNIKAFQLNEYYYNILSEKLDLLEQEAKTEPSGAEVNLAAYGYNPNAKGGGRGGRNARRALESLRRGMWRGDSSSTSNAKQERGPKNIGKREISGEEIKSAVATLYSAAMDHKDFRDMVKTGEFGKAQIMSPSSAAHRKMLSRYPKEHEVHAASAVISAAGNR